MSVTIEESRQAIVTLIDTLRSVYGSPLVIQYDNRTIDYSAQTRAFLEVEILYINGYQPGLMTAGKIQRQLGSIILTARVREGAGVSEANTLLEHFYPTMHMTDAMFPVRTHAATLTKARPKHDWQGQCAVIPFWYDN